jgi:hypothetical protein
VVALDALLLSLNCLRSNVVVCTGLSPVMTACFSCDLFLREEI